MAETKPRDRDPILDLTTEFDRQVVRIDGTGHELITPGELSVLDYHRIAKQSDRCREMMGRDLEEKEIEELSDMLRGLCNKLLIAPPEVHARLNDSHRLAIIGAFTDLQRGTPQAAGGTDAGAEVQPTGAS